MVIKLYEIFEVDFIGGRTEGELIRNKIEQCIKSGEVATIDFTGIETITQSFADEIIGLFVRSNGIEFIKKHIKVINASKTIRTILNFVVKYSQQEYQAA